MLYGTECSVGGGGRRYFAVSRVNISSAAAEKGRRKVSCSFGSTCYSLLLHTSAWTVAENTCLGEVVGGPGWLRVRVCMQVVFLSRLAKLAHQRVRHVDEMASYHPSWNTDQGDYYVCEHSIGKIIVRNESK